MYLPESPFTRAAKVALMSAAWVTCNVDSCEIPFDSNNQSENIIPIQKILSSHIGFHRFVTVTAKSEHLRQTLQRDTNSSLEYFKIHKRYIHGRMQPREKIETELPYQKASEIQSKTGCGVCKGSLVPLVPERTVGCICEEGE